MKKLHDTLCSSLALLALGASALAPASLFATDIAWTGAANDGGNVLTGTNWDGDAAPGASDRAQIGDAPEAVLSGSWAPQYLDIGTTAGKTGTLTVGTGGELSVTTISDGTSVEIGSIRMGAAAGAAGVLNIDGGTTTVYSFNTPNYAATSTVNMVSGTLNVTKWMDWGRNANGLSTFNQSGGTVNMGGNLWIGRENNGTAIYNQTGGTVNINGGTLNLGHTGGAKGSYVLGEDATINMAQKTVLNVGVEGSSTGYFTQYGTVNHAKTDCNIAQKNSYGYYTQESGVFNVNGLYIAPRNDAGVGVYTLNGGVLNANDRLALGGYSASKAGGKGYYIQNGGTAFIAAGVDCGVGNTANASGTMELNGGTLYTSYIRETQGTSTLSFNGGTVAVSNFTGSAAFISGIDTMEYGAGGLTLDTAGYEVVVSNGAVTVSHSGSAVVKNGAGKVTFDYLPPADSVKVNAGTVAIAADAPASPVPPMLAHRWSFASDYADTVTGQAAMQIGSNVALSDGKVTMSGNGNSTGSLNLGTNLLDTATATIEIWAKHNAVKKWARVFDYGPDNTHYFTMAWTYDSTAGKHRVDSKYPYNSGTKQTSVDDTTQPYTLDTEYYIAVTLEKSGNATVAKWQRRDVTTGEVLLTGTLTMLTGIHTFTNSVLYLGHSQFTSDYDANATYDEVRVWNTVLSDEALEASCLLGADATMAQLSAISEMSNPMTLEIASGATLDLGGNSLSVPALAPGGTLQNGTLTVTKSLKLTAGQTITVADGATLDLTGVTDVSITNPEDMPDGGWTFATSSSGGITAAAAKKLSGDLAGYYLYLKGDKATIGKPGFMIIFR